MSRKTTYSKEKYIHLLVRSNLNHPLFRSESDYETFMKYLVIKSNQYKFRILGYCLFKDHVHIIIENCTPYDVSTLLHGLLVLYTGYYHRKYDTTGSLFGTGFKKELITSNKDLICYLRYIHQKPKRMNICKTLDYIYSSYHDYIHPEEESILYRSTLYRLFDLHDDKKACNFFRSIHHEMESAPVMDLSKNLYNEVTVAKNIMKEALTSYGYDFDHIKKDHPFREKLVLKIHEESKLTHQEIADLLSLSRHIVGRIIRLNNHR